MRGQETAKSASPALMKSSPKRGGWSGGPVPEPSGRLLLVLAVVIPAFAVAAYALAVFA